MRHRSRYTKIFKIKDWMGYHVILNGMLHIILYLKFNIYLITLIFLLSNINVYHGHVKIIK